MLLQAVRSGLGLLTWGQDSFAYADGYDEKANRYRGFQFGRQVALVEDEPSSGVLVKAEAARYQLEAERATLAPTWAAPPTALPGNTGGAVGISPGTSTRRTWPARSCSPSQPKRFHGTVALDPTRVGRDASRIADEVVTQLAGPVGAEVKVTLEIEANIPGGAPEHVVRTVTENSRTLKFRSHGFEKE